MYVYVVVKLRVRSVHSGSIQIQSIWSYLNLKPHHPPNFLGAPKNFEPLHYCVTFYNVPLISAFRMTLRMEGDIKGDLEETCLIFKSLTQK